MCFRNHKIIFRYEHRDRKKHLYWPHDIIASFRLSA
uniref:Uncharacterized protein n=1 Tax=Arundo donax TaxID=35708 RepID=A0A0A9BYX7_ARUDO